MDPLAGVFVPAEASEERRLKAAQWSQFLKAPLVEDLESTKAFPFCLHILSDRIVLYDSQDRRLSIDFLNDHVNYQRKGLRGKNELLAKALGLSKGTQRVLDLSAGLGIDAVFMTQLGFQVTAIERSKLLFVLLQEALIKAPELQKSLSFVCEQSRAYLVQLKQNKDKSMDHFEGIYFDPMYPHKKKTALPKKEMVVFRELVGQDEDASLVLKEALETTAQRIVVKRPLGAPALLPGVRHSYEGKVVRYDVYMR